MDFDIEQRGRDYWARAGQGAPAFFVGRRVRYQGRQGLSNAVPGAPVMAEDQYRADDFAEALGLWAYAVAPTIACEGGRFTSLNSYDRAAFSYGIGQFAAHVPDGDFVCLFRRLLALPDARTYFPELGLAKGRIALVGTVPQPLEDAVSTAALMAWLNPDGAAVDTREVQVAARLIDWTRRSAAAREAQVQQMATSARAHLTHAARKVPLQNVNAMCCVAIIDLLHHGRGGRALWPKVAAALADAEPLARLLEIGGNFWASRKERLRAEIIALPELATYRWVAETCSFVAI